MIGVELRRWIKAGRIHVVQVGREMRILHTDIEWLLGPGEARLLALYGRVSRQGQAKELAEQVERLQRWAHLERAGVPTLVLTDIGSGLKESRRQLHRPLQLVSDGRVDEIAITSDDRLTRFGYSYLDRLSACRGVPLTVLEPGETSRAEPELKADLLTLVASLPGQLYGSDSPQYQELMQCATAILSSP